MRSIMQEKADGICFLCVALHADSSRKSALEEHHVIYGWGRRALSEKYGLKVYICPPHHRDSPESVHHNTAGDRDIDRILKVAAQVAFAKNYPTLNFTEIFGKNYITDEISDYLNKKPTKANSSENGKGFMLIEGDDELIDF